MLRTINMKYRFKRVLSLIILIIYSIALLPQITLAEDENLVMGGDFENEDNFLWSGCVRDSEWAYTGDWGIQVSNPYGDDALGYFDHILEYNDTVWLQEGQFYTFSAYVMNPLAEDASEPVASAYIGRNGEVLFIDISSVGCEWSLVTASFMATENAQVPLIITLLGGDIDMGFFVDDISILPESRVPDYTVLEGPGSVFVPDNGFADYRYNIVTYDTDDEPINILLVNADITVGNLPNGVEFEESSGTLRVHSTAETEKSFTITYSFTLGDESKEATKTVTTTKNLLSDPYFEEGEENWVSDGNISYIDGTVSLYAAEQGDWGYYTSVTYTKQLLLFAGNMYVFRASVGSDEEYSSSSVYISNLSFATSGYAEINITGIGGEWNSVTSAFMIEDTGLYDLTINLYAPSKRPIYLDNVYLGVEEEAPTSISIHAPGHIQMPSDSVILPCYGAVRNQLGNVMDACEPRLEIYPEDEGVYLDSENVIITRNAKRGDYTVVASFEDIETTHTITVSDDMVGDGGFEEKQPNEWWTASDGALFNIVDYDGDKSGHVYSQDSSCIVINNSYMEIKAGEYYVYSASPGFGEGVITAFIADAVTGDFIPFAQYNPLDGVKVPFSLDYDVLGRLVLYIESDGPIGILFDDIAICPSELDVIDVVVTGGEYGDFIRGSYSYQNNMTDSPDADISTTRWYISSTYDGHYEPIGVPNQDYLEFTPDMAGQYIVYEVTPVCAYTGLTGDSVRSLPLKISQQSTQAEEVDRPKSEMKPVELDTVKEHPFTDITSHWAEGMIASLANAGIVSGRTQSKFVPDYYVTRAEFATMVARAFSLVSVPYSGKFEDVSENEWYAGWVEACYMRGIIQGMDENTFAPNERITREQMATILMRAYLLCDGPMPYDLELRYYDNFLISDWAYDSVKNATNLNIFTGDDMNLFRPTDAATRAEAACCIYRVLKCF